jgi:hypothetical protein
VVQEKKTNEQRPCLSYITVLYRPYIQYIKFVRKIIQLAIDLEYENYILYTYVYIKQLKSEIIHLYWKVLYNTRQKDTSGWYQEPPHLI